MESILFRASGDDAAHPLDSSQDMGLLIVGELGQSGLNLLSALARVFSVLGICLLKEVFWIVVQNLLGRGEDLSGTVQNPCCSIGNHTKPNRMLRNQTGIFGGLKRGGKIIVSSDLMLVSRCLVYVFLES